MDNGKPLHERLASTLTGIDVEIAQLRGSEVTLEGELKHVREQLKTLEQARSLLAGNDKKPRGQKPSQRFLVSPASFELIREWVYEHSTLDDFTVDDAVEALGWSRARTNKAFQALRERDLIRLAGRRNRGPYIYRVIET